MTKYSRLAILTLVAIILLLAVTVFAYSARDALEIAGIAVNPKVFGVVLIAVVLVMYLYFVKLVRSEISRLNAQSNQEQSNS